MGVSERIDQGQQLHVRVRHEGDTYWATIEEYPGVFGTGDDLEELRDSVAEGLALALARPGEEPPRLTLGPLRPEQVATTDLVCA
jgi:predicted RNase H-like HicB family nuclease